MYKVKEIFYTLQGEGAHAGRAAVFCRFSGCNLWSGREIDRSNAICQFCDTDFKGTNGINGGRYSAVQLAQKVFSLWKNDQEGKPFVVCTGGEPLLQMDKKIIDAFHRVGLEVAVETNGTIIVPEGIDWVCVSPKAKTEIVVTKGDELKLVFPQIGAEPDKFTHLDFRHFFLQPMDNFDKDYNTQVSVRYCLEHPMWRLSLQTHKLLNIP